MQAWSVIRKMQIRGAPLIAIVALIGLAVDLYTNPKTIEELNNIANSATGSDREGSDIIAFIQKKMDYLKGSRPTAVNLSNALLEAEQAMTKELKEYNLNSTDSSISVKDVLLKAILNYAEFMLDRDVSDNRAIGMVGAEAIVKAKKEAKKDTDGDEKIHLVTICNTGSLATAGYGTALGVARALQEKGSLASITACETRPYNQGSRLTAFEIVQEKMPGGQLICDSAAGALMQVCVTTKKRVYAWVALSSLLYVCLLCVLFHFARRQSPCICILFQNLNSRPTLLMLSSLVRIACVRMVTQRIK